MRIKSSRLPLNVYVAEIWRRRSASGFLGMKKVFHYPSSQPRNTLHIMSTHASITYTTPNINLRWYTSFVPFPKRVRHLLVLIYSNQSTALELSSEPL